MRVREWVAPVVAVLRSNSPAARTVRIAAGFAIFVGVTWWAWTSTGDIDLDWAWIAVLLVVGVPLATAVLTIEQHISTYLADVTVPIVSSFRTSVVASAANYLPIPGAAIVRVGALSRAGSTTARATAVTALLGVQWLAITGIFVTPALVAADRPVIGVVVLAGSALALGGSTGWYWRRYPHQIKFVLVGATSVIFKVIVSAFNTYAGLRAVGALVDFASALLVSASGVLASAVGIFPGGLGIREFLSGVLGALGGLDPAVAALGAVVTRAVIGVGLAFVFLVSSIPGRRTSQTGSAADTAGES